MRLTNAELPDYQGESVSVPGAYVKGVDTDGDGNADVTSGTASGNLVIDYDATVTSTNGQVYTAATGSRTLTEMCGSSFCPEIYF